jgi:O-antigen ligase
MEYIQFHNGILDIGVRGGIPAIILLLICLYLSMRRSFQVAAFDVSAARASILLWIDFFLENLSRAKAFYAYDIHWTLFIGMWALNEYVLLRARQGSPKTVPWTRRHILADAPVKALPKPAGSR